MGESPLKLGDYFLTLACPSSSWVAPCLLLRGLLHDLHHLRIDAALVLRGQPALQPVGKLVRAGEIRVRGPEVAHDLKGAGFCCMICENAFAASCRCVP